MSQKNVVKLGRIFVAERWCIAFVMLALCCVAQAQQDKSAPAKASLTGRYEGSAKNKAEEVITVAIDLTEKEGALSGTIHSSHGDFPITGGSHQAEAVTIEFDAGGPGTISLHIADDKLVGTWSAGEDGGSLDVKKVAAQEGGAKDKSKRAEPGEFAGVGARATSLKTAILCPRGGMLQAWLGLGFRAWPGLSGVTPGELE